MHLQDPRSVAHRLGESTRTALFAGYLWEWFALLQRSFFSIFDAVYKFVRRQPPLETVRVPGEVLDEMLVTLLLAPLLSVDLDRQPVQELIATDAAPEFGFGVGSCPCSKGEANQVCRLAERRGDYVRLTNPVEVPRIGLPRRLAVTQKDFRTVICSRAPWSAHSGVLEAHAFLLALKWVARQAKKHDTKVPLLVDAKAAVGAVGKGHSFSRTLRTVVRTAASITMAANLLPRVAYIPSESNPADRPSRGKRNKPRNRWLHRVSKWKKPLYRTSH